MHRLDPAIVAGPFHRGLALDQISRAQLEGRRFRRLTRGVYADRALSLGVDEKIAAFRQALPPDAVLAGLSAAWAHGVPLAGLRDPVEVVCPQRIRPRRGLVARFGRLDASEVVWTASGPATSPARTAYDLARRARLPRAAGDCLAERFGNRLTELFSTSPGPYPAYPQALGFEDLGMLAGQPIEKVTARLALAVSWVDAVLRQTGTPVDALGAVVAAHDGARWVRSARVVLQLADIRAESPPESTLRVRVALSELPMAEPQVPIRDPGGRILAATDLGFHAFRLGAEYDGAWHDETSGEQIPRDRERDNLAHRAGWELVHFDAAGLRDPLTLLRTVHATLIRLGAA